MASAVASDYSFKIRLSHLPMVSELKNLLDFFPQFAVVPGGYWFTSTLSVVAGKHGASTTKTLHLSLNWQGSLQMYWVSLLGQCIAVTSYERHGGSNNRQLDCLLNMIIRLTKKKTLKPHITCPLWRESTGRRLDEFPSQRASNSTSWCHYGQPSSSGRRWPSDDLERSKEPGMVMYRPICPGISVFLPSEFLNNPFHPRHRPGGLCYLGWCISCLLVRYLAHVACLHFFSWHMTSW